MKKTSEGREKGRRENKKKRCMKRKTREPKSTKKRR